MSYAASLLGSYPTTTYAPSSLLSDNLVQRTTYDTIFPSNAQFLNDNRLFSDQLAYSSLNYNPTTTSIYQPSLYPSNAVHPATKRNPIKASTQFSKPLPTNQRHIAPPNDSYASLNDITEYSDSLATASNTNTASTVARTIDGNSKKTFTNHNKSNSNQHIWSPVQAKTQKSQPINQKKTPAVHSDEDRTPVPSHQNKPPPQQQQQPNHPPESNHQASSVDIQAWLNDTKKDSPFDDEFAEQAWSSKIEHLHQMKAQHEKDKAKSSRALPIPTKKKETKPNNSKSRPPNDATHNKPAFDSYFDSIFDGDYFRKPFSTDYIHNSSVNQPGSRKNKPTTNSFSKRFQCYRFDLFSNSQLQITVRRSRRRNLLNRKKLFSTNHRQSNVLNSRSQLVRGEKIGRIIIKYFFFFKFFYYYYFSFVFSIHSIQFIRITFIMNLLIENFYKKIPKNDIEKLYKNFELIVLNNNKKTSKKFDNCILI